MIEGGRVNIVFRLEYKYILLFVFDFIFLIGMENNVFIRLLGVFYVFKVMFVFICSRKNIIFGIVVLLGLG